ncbi:hypothetical protein AB1Y20_001346 [Prymnesium parvum]|uniref:Uncharacterized protein n=1 Tax=Prymnesium parvum TaxID=97485 RepID=A0AB34KBS4_PRYPA
MYQGLQAAAVALVEALDDAVSSPRDATDLLFAGGLAGLLTTEQSKTVQRAQRIWRLTHEVLDEALSHSPGLVEHLEVQMSTRRGLVDAKVRKSFLYVIELARTRTQKA